MSKNSMEFIRKMNHYDIEFVANKLSMSMKEVEALEKLDSLESVNVLTLIKISRVLNTSVERLLGEQENSFVEMFTEYVRTERRKNVCDNFIRMYQKTIDEEIALIDGTDERAAERITEAFFAVSPIITNSDNSRAIAYNEAPKQLKSAYDAMSKKEDEFAKCESKLIAVNGCITSIDNDPERFTAYINPIAK